MSELRHLFGTGPSPNPGTTSDRQRKEARLGSSGHCRDLWPDRLDIGMEGNGNATLGRSDDCSFW